MKQYFQQKTFFQIVKINDRHQWNKRCLNSLQRCWCYSLS